MIDDIALVHYIERRARETSIVRIYAIAAITKGLGGTQLTEMGMLAEGGALAFTDDGRHSCTGLGAAHTHYAGG